jgi:hypothetical protein
VRHETPVSCSGSYLKLLAGEDPDLSQFDDRTPYAILFGPDRCGDKDQVRRAAFAELTMVA